MSGRRPALIFIVEVRRWYNSKDSITNISLKGEIIDMKGKQIRFIRCFLIIGLLAVLTLIMAACSSKPTSSSVTSSSVTTKPTGSLSSITITPSAPPDLTSGYTMQFKAIGTYADGSTADISDKVLWATSDRTTVNLVSYIAGYGEFVGMGVGTASISASLNGITSPAVSLTVVYASTTTSP